MPQQHPLPNVKRAVYNNHCNRQYSNKGGQLLVMLLLNELLSVSRNSTCVHAAKQNTGPLQPIKPCVAAMLALHLRAYLSPNL